MVNGKQNLIRIQIHIMEPGQVWTLVRLVISSTRSGRLTSLFRKNQGSYGRYFTELDQDSVHLTELVQNATTSYGTSQVRTLVRLYYGRATPWPVN